jgi:phage-related protein
VILLPIKKDYWAFYAIGKADGSSPLLDELGSLPQNHQASVKRLLAIINNAAGSPQGPRLLSKDICHRVNDKYAINEFLAGRLRLLWFYSSAERKVVICSTVFMKKTQKTPRKIITAAINDKKAYDKAVTDNNIMILEDVKDE